MPNDQFLICDENKFDMILTPSKEEKKRICQIKWAPPDDILLLSIY